MSAPSHSESSYEAIREEEQAWVSQRRGATGVSQEDPTVGLALSGGGIRSATFNLGVINALDRSGVLKHIDYLSTVSGGGYIGSCLSWLINHHGAKRTTALFDTPVANQNTSVLGWLRSHGKYLISEPGFSGWTLGASILAAVCLNLLVFLPIILLLISVASADLFDLKGLEQFKILGGQIVNNHDGFGVLFLIGLCFLIGYLFSMLLFAAISGVAIFRSTENVLRMRRLMAHLLKYGLSFVIIGLIPVFAHFDQFLVKAFDLQHWAQTFSHLSYVVPLVGGALATARASSVANKTNSNTGVLASIGLALIIYGAVIFAYHLVAHTQFMHSNAYWICLLLSLVLALVCDPNWVSMHSYYRARIASAFLPQLEMTDGISKDESMVYQLHQMTPTSGAPLHLLNTTMNTSTSKNYKLRSREGACFVLSPLFSGSPLCGYRKTSEFMSHGVPLSTAATISGAAVDPNNSIVRSRSISMLMSLFNFRLGFWTSSPRLQGAKRFGADWYTLVGREVLGVALDESSRHLHLSDGGQFENLGVYELIRRRCRLVIACDSGADPDYTLSDLAKMINLCKADFNARVEVCARPLIEQQASGKGFCPLAVGKIYYDDGTQGKILYIKSMLYENLPANVYSYAQTSPSFPNESTANQFYGEAQFDAYETLGRTIIERILDKKSQPTAMDLLEQASRIADHKNA